MIAALPLIAWSVASAAPIQEHMDTGGAVADLAPEPPLAADLKLGLWRPRLGGQFALSATPTADRVSVDEDLRLDNSESVFNVELSLRRPDGWKIRASGFSFASSRSDTFAANNLMPASVTFGSLTLDPGDVINARLAMTSVSVDIGKALWRPLAATSPINRHGRYLTDLRISPTLGLRVADIDAMISEVGVGSDGASTTVAAVILGIDIEFIYEPDEPLAGIVHSFSFESFAGAGPAIGGDGGIVVQVGAGISAMMTPNFGAMFGYRLLEFRVEDGPFEFDAGLQGLFVAFQMRF